MMIIFATISYSTNFIFILLGMLIGGYFGYLLHRKYRAPEISAGDRIGKMVHISEGLNSYLEKKTGVLKSSEFGDVRKTFMPYGIKVRREQKKFFSPPE